MKINITDKERKEIEEFADKRLGSSNHYKKRGGFKREDLVAGAMGELAVYKALKRKGHELAKPDFEVYEVRNKSFDADLRLGKKRIHVKSQTKKSSSRYGRSWLMQRHDPLFKGTGYNHYMACAEVDADKNEVELLGFFSVHSIIKKGLIGECKVPSFRMSKVAIYFDSLDQGISKHNRWRLLNGN